MKYFWAVLLVFLTGCSAFAQKINVGFDKSADFGKYRTFSWPKAEESPEMTVRRLMVMGEIEDNLKSKGLVRVEEGGDLILSGFGVFGGESAGEAMTAPILPTFSTPIYTSTSMWEGASYSPGSTVIRGTFVLQMAERATGKVVWQGAVKQKVDMDNKAKSIERIKTAIAKLLEKYPPKR